MHNNTPSGNSEEPPSCKQWHELKEFHSAGRGFWSHIPDSDWNDWHWQLKHRITSLDHLQRFMTTITPEEFAGRKLANLMLERVITPHCFNLSDTVDELWPLRWQVMVQHHE